jgi:hypothetical protein
VLSQPFQRSCMPVGHGVTMVCRIGDLSGI